MISFILLSIVVGILFLGTLSVLGFATVVSYYEGDTGTAIATLIGFIMFGLLATALILHGYGL
jgi:hypothetical protein